MAEGTRNMAVGGVIFAVGSAITLVTFSAARGGGHFILAWGAILFGGLQVLIGVVQFLLRDRSPIDRLLSNSTRHVKGLLRAMIATAQSDGALDEKKVDAMHAVLRQVEPYRYPASIIDDVAAAMRLDTDTVQYLAAVEYELTATEKQQIIRACLMAGGAGSLFTQEKDRLLRNFGVAMKMTEPQYVAVVNEMLRPVAPAPAAQGSIGPRASEPSASEPIQRPTGIEPAAPGWLRRASGSQ